MPNTNFTDVSVVGINDELVAKVAERVKVPVERVKRYLADKDDQDNALLRAFLYFGVGPFNKTFV